MGVSLAVGGSGVAHGADALPGDDGVPDRDFDGCHVGVDRNDAAGVLDDNHAAAEGAAEPARGRAERALVATTVFAIIYWAVQGEGDITEVPSRQPPPEGRTHRF